MNSCTAVHRLLALRPDDWSEQERRQVEQHLLECADCRDRSQAYAEQRTFLEGFPPAGLTGPQRREFYARLERKRRGHVVRSRLSTILYAVAGAVVLGAIVLAATFFLQWSRPGHEPTPGSSPSSVATPGAKTPYPEPEGSPYPAPEPPLPTYDGPVVTIVFACYSFEQPAYEALAAEFTAQNPSIHIQIIPLDDLTGGGWAQRSKMFQSLLSSADVAYFIVYLEAARQGMLRDLTPFIEADPTFAPEDFYPGVLDTFRLHGQTWAVTGQVMGMDVIFYDRDAFDQAGVPYPTLVWTREDFLSAAQRLTLRQGQDVTRYGYVDYAWAFSRLAEISDSEQGEGLALDAPAIIEAVRWYLDLSQRYQVMPEMLIGQEGNNRDMGLIDSGKAAMWSDMIANYQYRSEQRKVGIAAFPTTAGPVVPAFTYGYMMSAGTEHPEECWRWIRFLTYQQVTDEYREVQDLPARRSVAERVRYWDQFAPEIVEIARYAAEHMVVYRNDEANWQLDVAVSQAGQGKPIEEVLAEAQISLTTYLAQQAQATPVPIVVTTPRPTEPGVEAITFAPPPLVDTQAYRALADEFNQAHPDLQVQFVSSDQAECFAGGRSVDYADSRAELLNLQPLLDADPSFSLDDFYPRFLDDLRFGGNLWGIPIDAQLRVIYYNPQLFDATGVPYPQAGWTLDDFLAVATALTKGEGGEKQYGFLPLNGHTSDFIPFLMLQGAGPWDDQDRPRFDDPQVVEAVRWYTDLVLRYGVMPNSPGEQGDPGPGKMEELYALVRDGRVAMWSDFTGLNRSDAWPSGVQVGVAPMPLAGPGETGMTNFLSNAFFISANATHPQECWEWIRFVSSHAEIVHGFPARRSVFESPAWAAQAGPAAEAYRGSQDYADFHYPTTPDLGPQIDLLHQALAEILQGERVEVVLAKAQQEAEK